MQIHPRYWIVTEAKCSLDMAIIRIEEKHDLTIEAVLDAVLKIALGTNKVERLADRKVEDLNEPGKEVLKVVEELEKKHELTPTESFRNLLSPMMNFNTAALRMERHPNDPDKKGDEA